jgi:uncharacterized membrane protein
MTTVAIVLASSELNYYILEFAGDSNSYLFLGEQSSIHLEEMINLTVTNPIIAIGIIVSFLVGFLIALIASFIERKIIDVRAFKRHVTREDED